MVSSCEPETTVDYGGTEPFVSKVGSTFYVNGYDVLITRVKSYNEGEGLLYFPLARNRIPVVWKGVTLTDSKIYDYMGNSYGCLTSGEVLVVGSDPKLIGSDLTKQYNALYNSLNSPGSYSGTFGEALDSLKIKSELLQDAKNRTKANIESLLSVTKAVKTGFKALEKTFMDTYKSADNFPQIAKDLLALKPDSTNPNQVLNRLQVCIAQTPSTTGGKKQAKVNLYQLKLAECLDDSNILQETQEYAESATELLNNYTDFETLVRNSQLKCGCTSIIDDYTTPDGNCQSVIYYIELLKRDITQNKSSHKFKNSVGATGQLSVNNFCIDRLQVKFMGDNIEVDPQSKQKASTGIDFSVPNSSNIVLSINVLDEEKKLEKIDSVWKYLSGQGTRNISFTSELDEVLLKKIFPKETQQKSKDFLPYINKYLKEFGITSCEERIHFFTQIAEETTQLKDLSELPSDYASSQSKYKGRGLMQLTGWEYNYEPFETYCKEQGDDVDFENHPEEVATNPKYAVLSAFWYWKIEQKCSRYCADLSEESLLKVSKLVNCGNTEFCGYKKNPNTGVREKCYDCEPNGWSKRKKEFERLKGLFPCE